MHTAQVSALALCKVSKTEVLLRWLGRARRHEHEDRLFWRLDEVPQEALQALQVSGASPCTPLLTAPCSADPLSMLGCIWRPDVPRGAAGSQPCPSPCADNC